MLKRILLLAVVLGAVFLSPPTASADGSSFKTKLKGQVTFADGNCCGFETFFEGSVRRGAFPGVGRGTYEAVFREGDFDIDTCGVTGEELCHPRICDVRPDLPEFCAQRYDLDFHFQGADGSFRLQTTYEGFGYDDWWPRAFTWDVTESTGLYAGWTGSGTYTFDFRRKSFVRSILTLKGAIGPAN